MSAIQEAVKKAQASAVAAPEAPPAASGGWGWLPNLLMLCFLAVALWNYLSEREYRRQMEARLETTIQDLERTRADFERVERQNREMEDLMHAELEAANGRIARMKFDLDALRAERDAADAKLRAASTHVETLESQNRRLHGVIRSLRGSKSRSAQPAAAGSLAWDPSA